MKTVKKLWIAVAVLALLAPLGLLIPAFFGAGGAWGEWSAETIKSLIGYLPEGMQKFAHFWKSPMPDYGLPSQRPEVAHRTLGYFLSAIIGIAATAGVAYLLVKILKRRKDREK